MCRNKISEEKIEIVRFMRSRGCTLKQIGSEIGFTTDAVKKLCMREEIPLNTEKRKDKVKKRELDAFILELYNTCKTFTEIVEKSNMKSYQVAMRATRMRRKGIYVPYMY